MKSIPELLRAADPLRHEPITLAEQRHNRRRAILAAASAAPDRAGTAPGSRIALLITLGFVMIVVLFLAERMWSPLVSNVAAAVHFEVRLAENKPALGLREAKVSGTERAVYLHDEVIVTNGDISRANIIQVDHSPQYNVEVEFNSYGAEKIRAATQRHIGRPLAILLDGQVILTAIVREPITSSAVVSGNLSRSDAEKIVHGITIGR